jgi:hypothetical protein
VALAALARLWLVVHHAAEYEAEYHAAQQTLAVAA